MNHAKFLSVAFVIPSPAYCYCAESWPETPFFIFSNDISLRIGAYTSLYGSPVIHSHQLIVCIKFIKVLGTEVLIVVLRHKKTKS